MKAELRDCYVNHLSSAVPALQTSTNPVQTQELSAKQTQPGSGFSCPRTSPSTSWDAGATPVDRPNGTWKGSSAGHSLSPWLYGSSDLEHRDPTASCGNPKWESQVMLWADGLGLLYTMEDPTPALLSQKHVWKNRLLTAISPMKNSVKNNRPDSYLAW